MASRLNIFELNQSTQHVVKQSFLIILERCHKKILEISSKRSLQCKYNVPVFLYGQPPFNAMECIYYIKKELENNGFVVQLEKFTLFISWAHIPNRNQCPDIEIAKKYMDSNPESTYSEILSNINSKLPLETVKQLYTPLLQSKQDNLLGWR